VCAKHRQTPFSKIMLEKKKGNTRQISLPAHDRPRSVWPQHISALIDISSMALRPLLARSWNAVLIYIDGQKFHAALDKFRQSYIKRMLVGVALDCE
jgi:hypothetical protein